MERCISCMHRKCRERFPWGIPGSLTSDFVWSRWRRKRSRHSRRMRNPQFYVSGKRPTNTIRYIENYKGVSVPHVSFSKRHCNSCLNIYRKISKLQNISVSNKACNCISNSKSPFSHLRGSVRFNGWYSSHSLEQKDPEDNISTIKTGSIDMHRNCLEQNQLLVTYIQVILT